MQPLVETAGIDSLTVTVTHGTTKVSSIVRNTSKVRRNENVALKRN